MKLFKRHNKKTNTRDVLKSFEAFWDKAHKIVFVFVFLILAGFGGYVWYQSLYGGAWSADKKMQYLNAQEKSISLKERELQKALEAIQKKRNEYGKEYQPIKDIFIPYPGSNLELTNTSS